MNNKYSIGVDPGKNGSIVIIDAHGMVLLKPTPKVGTEIDTHKLSTFFEGFDKTNCHGVIEDVHSIFGVGAKANFQFGRALGLVEGIIAALGIPFTKVAPKKWQEEMWQGIKPIQINTGKKTKEGNIKYKTDTKATSLIAAKRLFPNLDLRGDVTVEYYSDTHQNRKLKRVGEQIVSKKKDHDGNVDALLIAEYCRRKFK